MKYILIIFAFLFLTAASTDGSRTGKAPVRTTPAACTLVVTPADGDVTVIGTCYRDGKFLIIDGKILYAAAGTAGDLTVAITSVTGAPVIDVTYLVGATVGTGSAGVNKEEAHLGYGMLFSAGVGWSAHTPVFASTTTFEFVGSGAHLQGNTPASGSSISFNVKLPIVGWN